MVSYGCTTDVLAHSTQEVLKLDWSRGPNRHQIG
jgi:hypothetical protein